MSKNIVTLLNSFTFVAPELYDKRPQAGIGGWAMVAQILCPNHGIVQAEEISDPLFFFLFPSLQFLIVLIWKPEIESSGK